MRKRLRAVILSGMRSRTRTIELGPWRFAHGPRVLIEHPDEVVGLDLAVALRTAGCTVAICHGPDRGGDPATRCPLHRLEPCAIVEGADAVVTALDLDADDGREVLRGLRTRYPGTPLVVAATPAVSLALGPELRGCTVVATDAAPDDVAAAVTAIVR